MARLVPEANLQAGDDQMTVEQMEKPQLLSAKDLADIIGEFREMWQWSRDVLSAISKLSIRTIQRVEKGNPLTAIRGEPSRWRSS
jgi:hypothetical protein